MHNADILLKRLTVLAKMAIAEKDFKEAHKIMQTQLNFILELRKAEPMDPANWTTKEMTTIGNYARSLMEQMS
jgi:hypothetical protein